MSQLFRLAPALFVLIVSIPCLASPSEPSPVGPPVEKATTSQKEAASSAFASGDEAFDIQDYETALRHYRKSVEQVNSPNSRLMVARCLLELGRLDEAYAEYAHVTVDAADDERYADARSTAEDERQALKSRLAWVVLEMGDMPDDVVLLLDDRKIGDGRPTEPIGINPGGAVLVAEAPDGTRATAEVHLAAGRTVTVTLARNETKVVGSPTQARSPTDEATETTDDGGATPQDESPPHPLRPWAIAAGGVAIAGAAGVTAFGLLSQARFDSLTQNCAGGQCPSSSQRDIDKGQTYQTLANVSLGVGIAGLTTAAVLLLLDKKPRKETATMRLDLGWQSLQLSGEF